MRLRLMEATVELLVERGFAGTSVEAVADLYSKVTRRPRSKLERLLSLLEPLAVPRRPEGRVSTQLALFYLVAAASPQGEVTRSSDPPRILLPFPCP